MAAAIEQIRSSKFEVRSPRTPHLISLALLVMLTLGMFADVLFTAQPMVLSNGDTDLAGQFVHWRSFGFGELRHGNLALWNPHLFSGAPFFGGFQSALLYPPNLMFLVLPLGLATNWSIALHVFLAGAFVYWWAAYRGLHPLACFLSAVMFMLGGPYFLHIYAGHLPNLCTMVWAPLLFVAMDGVFKERSLRWILLGMLAVAMQVLAGHPQYVFYTGVAAGIYGILCLGKAEQRGKAALGLGAICVGGAGLSAVQLLTGLWESGETLRGAGVTRDFAASFSFPPENLLTLLAPGFFGNVKDLPYWGHCWLWEMSLFGSVTGLVLAVCGAVSGERSVRRFSVTMAAVLLLLAFGGYTPLFRALYEWVPGFDKFRGSSKFIFLASLFVALLAGIGLDRLLKGGVSPRRLAWGSMAAAVVVAAGALWVRESALDPALGGEWANVLKAVRDTRETYLQEEAYSNSGFVLESGRQASRSLLVAGGTLAAIAALLFFATRFRKLVGAMVLIAVAELFAFAHGSLDTFDLRTAVLPELKRFLAGQPGHYRTLDLSNPNTALSLGTDDIGGYDPNVLVRYAQFLGFTMGQNPGAKSQYVPFAGLHRLHAMLRCQFALSYGKDAKLNVVKAEAAPLERLQLVRNYRVLEKRDDIFAALAAPAFDLRKEVILESQPNPQPVFTTEMDEVRLMEASTDSLSIEATLASPAILLITDSYSKGWQVRALGQPTQPDYQIMPANYCLRAVPLAAGHHRIRVEYFPAGFAIGKWISVVSVVAYACLQLWALWAKLRVKFL